MCIDVIFVKLCIIILYFKSVVVVIDSIIDVAVIILFFNIKLYSYR